MSGVVPPDVLALGLVIGLLYALLAMGFVIVHKATRVLNMAHGDIGGFGSVLLVYATVRWHLGFWPSFLLAVAAGVVVGIVVERAFISRFRDAPRLVVLVATLGLAQLIVVVNQLILSPRQQAELIGGTPFPMPFPWTLHVFGATLRPPAVLTIVLVPLVLVVLASFFRYHRFGLAMRASAENTDNARLLGVPTAKVSMVAWALGGGLSATAAVLVGATSGTAANFGVGPPLLLRALAPAMAARLTSLPRAVAWALGLGVVEQVLLFNFQNSGVVDAVLLVFILGSLMVQRRAAGRAGELGASSWPVSFGHRPLSRALAESATNRRLRQGALAAATAVVALTPLAVSDTTTVVLVHVMGFAAAGVSLTLLTAHGGQISLGQWAVAGVGGMLAARVDNALGWPLWATVLVAAGGGAVAALVVGVPALRLQGPLLAVTTLAFAVAASGYLFRAPWFTGGTRSISVDRPDLVASDRALYYLGALLLAGVIAVAARARSGRLGRMIAATRDNERTAAAAGLDVVRTKLTTFALAGGMAGIGGWLAVYADGIGDAAVFSPAKSLSVVMFSLLGGIATLTGPVIGALAVMGLPRLFPGEAFLAALATGVGVLNVLLFLPAGLMGLPLSLRDLVVRGPRPDDDTEPAPATGPTAETTDQAEAAPDQAMAGVTS